MSTHTILAVKLTPNSHADEILSWDGDLLRVKIKAIAEKGKANNELISYLSVVLDLPEKAIRIAGGKTSRNKRLEITGVSKTNLDERIQKAIANPIRVR